MPYRRRPDSSWGLAFFIASLVVLWLLLGTQIAHGQTENTSEPPNLTSSLDIAERMLIMLAQRLAERQHQISDLQINLRIADEKLTALAESSESLRSALEESLASLENSQTALRETSTSLDALSMRYDALEASWQEYRKEMQSQVNDLQRERNLWKWAAIGAGVLAVVAGVIAVVR